MTTLKLSVLILALSLLLVYIVWPLPTPGGRQEACMRIMQPKNRTVAVGDQVQAPCRMEDFDEYVAINCKVNDRDNKATWNVDAQGCSINFTAKEEGQLELSCIVWCIQATYNYTMVWTAEAEMSSTARPSPSPSTGSGGSGAPNVTPSECGAHCEGGSGDDSGTSQLGRILGGTLGGISAIAIVLIAISILLLILCKKMFCKKEEKFASREHTPPPPPPLMTGTAEDTPSPPVTAHAVQDTPTND